jgi:hypothetical protein
MKLARKNMIKKMFIGGIVFLFLFTACLPVLASEEFPDLIIEDMTISPSNDPWQEKFSCQVKNVGNASVPYGKAIDITVTVQWKIFGLIPLKIIRQFNGGTISSGFEPGEIDKITFAGSYQMPVFGFYSFYCVVDPDQIIDESDNLNNDYTETVFFIFGASLP